MPEAEKDAAPLPISQYWPRLGFSVSKSTSVFSQKKMKNQKATGLGVFSRKKKQPVGGDIYSRQKSKGVNGGEWVEEVEYVQNKFNIRFSFWFLYRLAALLQAHLF